MTIFRASILSVVLLSASAFAQDSESLFANISAFENRQEISSLYPLTLSALKKINGQWQAEYQQAVLGDVRRLTYELKRPYTLRSAWDRVQQYFSKRGDQLIFECTGLSCGSSNAWANEHFAVKQLYGLDLSQHYQVWKSNREKDNVIEIIYLVERGNRRVYLQRDTLKPQDFPTSLVPSAAVLAKYFYRDREIMLAGISFNNDQINIDSNGLRPFVRAFNQQPFRPLEIVVYDDVKDVSDNKRALDYAQSVAAALIKLGIQKGRIRLKGIAGEPSQNQHHSVQQHEQAGKKVMVKLPSGK